MYMIISYSRKLLRKKTFANFKVLCDRRKFSLETFEEVIDNHELGVGGGGGARNSRDYSVKSYFLVPMFIYSNYR